MSDQPGGRVLSEPEAPDLLTERQVASRYHVTVHSVRRWRREGRIGFLKIGRQVLFRPGDLALFESRHEVDPTLARGGRRRQRSA